MRTLGISSWTRLSRFARLKLRILCNETRTQAQPISYNVFTVENLAAKPDQLKKYMIENGPAAGTSKRFDNDSVDDGGNEV